MENKDAGKCGTPMQQEYQPPKTTPINLYQLLEQAASDPADSGLSFCAHGNFGSIEKRITYRSLRSIAHKNAALLPCMKSEDSPVVLLHFDNHQDGIEWFWSVIVAGYLPAISTPFTNDLEQRGTFFLDLELNVYPGAEILTSGLATEKHILHLKTLLKDPVILTNEKLVPEFLGVPGLKLQTIETIHGRHPNTYTPSSPNFAGSSKPSEATAVLMLTSGSTGNAKAVCLRHDQLLRSIKGKSQHHGTTKLDSFLNWIGLDHVANLTESHLHAMFLAAEQIHVQAADLLLDPTRFLTLISRHRITHSYAPNFFLASLCANLEKPHAFKESEEPNLSHFRTLTSGGEANVVETADKLTKYLSKYGTSVKNGVIRPGFGMTETCAGSIYNLECPSYDLSQSLEFCSLGTCIPGLTMRISSDAGAIVGPGEVGNLELYGELIFHEYFNNASATGEAFTADGWFVTGDKGLVDLNGRLRLTGRVKGRSFQSPSCPASDTTLFTTPGNAL